MTAAALLEAMCWCERTTVMVPIHWVSEALTGSCGANCGPGCPSRADDNQDYDDDPTEVARTGKKAKMTRFNPSTYDARKDSSFGYSSGGPRTAYPNDVILEVAGGDPTLCACGCAEAPRGKGATFGMGHDARLRGKLSRAIAAGVQVVLTDAGHNVVEVLDPREYAARFSTAKLDWRQSVIDSAAKAKKGHDAEATVLAKALGPQVGDTELIRVGRWEKTGKILAVYQDGAEVLYEYVDSRDQIRHARKGADGKIREVDVAGVA